MSRSRSLVWLGIYFDLRYVIHYISNDEVWREFVIVVTARFVGGELVSSAEFREVRWVKFEDLCGYTMDKCMCRCVDDYLCGG